MDVLATVGGASAIAAALILLFPVTGWARHLLGGSPGPDDPGSAFRSWPEVAVLMLLVLPVVALQARVEGANRAWFGGVTAAAVMGLALIAVSRTLLLLKAVHPDATVAIGAVGFVPAAAWLLSCAMIGIRDGDVPIPLGLTSAAVLILAACAIGAATIRDRGAARCFGGVLMVVMTGWLVIIAAYLFRGG